MSHRDIEHYSRISTAVSVSKGEVQKQTTKEVIKEMVFILIYVTFTMAEIIFKIIQASLYATNLCLFHFK